METQEQSAVSASAGSQEPTKKTSGYGGFYTGMGPAREIDVLVETPHFSLGDMKTQEMTSASAAVESREATKKTSQYGGFYTGQALTNASPTDPSVSAQEAINRAFEKGQRLHLEANVSGTVFDGESNECGITLKCQGKHTGSHARTHSQVCLRKRQS